MNTIPDNWKPYFDGVGPNKPDDISVCRWFHLELDSRCNLRCALCFAGNEKPFQVTHGRMSLDFVERVLDKIQAENPNAVIRCYGNSEPFIYPWLPEVIASANRRGFRFELSSNLNYVQRLEETLAAGPAFLLVGFSGWTQESYARTHIGGNLDKVKENMIKVASLHDKYPVPLIANYHVYADNKGKERDEARAFAEANGYQFSQSPARSISLEHTLAYLRWKERSETGSVPPLGLCSKGLDWDAILPESPNANYLANVPRLIFTPDRAREFYSRWPVPAECPVKDIGCYIRWDGAVTLCPIESDRRLDIGNYLDMSQGQMSAARCGHPLCRECLRYRYNLYGSLVDYNQWGME